MKLDLGKTCILYCKYHYEKDLGRSWGGWPYTLLIYIYIYHLDTRFISSLVKGCAVYHPLPESAKIDWLIYPKCCNMLWLLLEDMETEAASPVPKIGSIDVHSWSVTNCSFENQVLSENPEMIPELGVIPHFRVKHSTFTLGVSTSSKKKRTGLPKTKVRFNEGYLPWN